MSTQVIEDARVNDTGTNNPIVHWIDNSRPEYGLCGFKLRGPELPASVEVDCIVCNDMFSSRWL